MWRGRGNGGYPTIEDFEYAQEIRFSHDGRPFLAYESRAWLIDGGRADPPARREVGWWRPVTTTTGPDEVEVLLFTPTGIMELYIGAHRARLEMATDAVVRTATAKEVTAGRRLYGIVEGALLYAHEMAARASR